MMTPKKRIPSPPSHLSREGKKLWRDLMAEYVIDNPGAIAILSAAIESHDRCMTARRVLAVDGFSVMDRYGIPRVHPLCPVVRDAEAAFGSGFGNSTLAPPIQRRRNDPGGRP